MTTAPQSFNEFWPVYLRAHQSPTTRGLHFFGTAAGIVVGAIGLALTFHPGPILIGLIMAYAFAWLGHAIVEHNKPATFSHPLWSLRGDLRMFWMWVTGRLNRELQRAGAG